LFFEFFKENPKMNAAAEEKDDQEIRKALEREREKHANPPVAEHFAIRPQNRSRFDQNAGLSSKSMQYCIYQFCSILKKIFQVDDGIKVTEGHVALSQLSGR
jgi:hypothetical protein